MNDMYVGQSPLERGHDETEEDPLVTENNRLTDRIAELTTEVTDLKSKLDFANVMNADQDKTVAELTAEVARYKAALTEIVDLTEETYVIGDIARNALKDGV